MQPVDCSSVALHLPAILIPQDGIDLSTWAVVACDQYSSQPEYWHEIENLVGDNPSTLHLIFPEAFLENYDASKRIEQINATMRRYRETSILRECSPGVLVVERTTSRGECRPGMVVALDLEAYDFHADASSLIRATEGTVVDRLPPRIKVREQAALEIPHIMVLIDDPEDTVIGPLRQASGTKLYDFDLMKNAGHLQGTLVEAPDTLSRMSAALGKLATPQRMAERYGSTGNGPLLYAIGDGNHSLATAKMVWENLKRHAANPRDLDNHPARHTLAEIVNVHGAAIRFEPIHRFVSHVTGSDMPQRLVAFLASQGTNAVLKTHNSQQAGRSELIASSDRPGQTILFVHHGVWYTVSIPTPRFTLEVGTVQSFLDACVENVNGQKVDYIHGESVLVELCRRPATAGFFLPPFAKQDLFKTILVDGALPRKSFSMGDADEKRFYMECRSIDK